jgi:hypothetical protein
MGEAENKQVIQRAFDAWAAGTGGVFDLLAPTHSGQSSGTAWRRAPTTAARSSCPS